MNRLKDEHNPDDWDGADYSEEMFDPELHVPERQGQGAYPDKEAQIPSWPVDNKTYVGDWLDIARRARYRAGYRCQNCGIMLVDRKDLLHVHHLDGNKNNNEDWNLMPLCVLCHADRDNHRHLLDRLPPEDVELLAARRNEPLA